MHATVSLILSLAAATVVLHPRPSGCSGPDELDDVLSFVQSVLATADRDELGLPDNVKPVPQRQRGPAADGRLPADVQRYLERMVSVSSALDKQTLVAMLWDDSVDVEDDQEPHSVFDLYRRRGETKRSHV